MKTVVEFPDQSVLSEEAAKWLIRLDGDAPPTPEDMKTLGEWLQRSPAHREELKSLASLWGGMNVLTELAVPLVKARWEAAHTRRERVTGLARLWRSPTLLAASVIVVAAAVGLIFVYTEQSDPLLTTNGFYSTAVGKQSTTTLADGSEVMLNTNSRLRVDYDDRYRNVYLLRGEALFRVAKNAQAPSRVYAGNGRIEAVGTAFSVYLNGGEINVAVTEGRVSLAARREAPSEVFEPGVGSAWEISDAGDKFVQSLGMVTAGQVATIRGSAAGAAGTVAALEVLEPITPEELAGRLAWREGVLMFSGDRLEDVVDELSRYTTLSIEIPDAALRNMRVGGRFPVGETAAMLAALETNFNLQVSRIGHDRVVLTSIDE